MHQDFAQVLEARSTPLAPHLAKQAAPTLLTQDADYKEFSMNLRAQPQVRFRHRHLLKPVTTTALTTLLALTLSACGGDSSSDSSDNDHNHDHAEGGRLIYSLSGSADTLKMFDQTVASEQFTSTTVATGADAQLVLSNDGVTLAMLNGSDLSIVSSGLEHMHGEDAHAHAVATLTAAHIADVAQVVATTDHFSVLKMMAAACCWKKSTAKRACRKTFSARW